MTQGPVAYATTDRDVFPFTVESYRSDTGEVLWTHTATGPGPIDVPGFGHLGVRISVRVTYADGTVEETP